MFDLLTLKNSQDYFKVMNSREKKGVFFCRYIGYDEEKIIFYRQYQVATQKKGIYIKQTIQNPTENEVHYFFQTIGGDSFSLEPAYIAQAVEKWFKNVKQAQKQSFCSALLFVLEGLLKQGSNLNILKNAFVKYMCWSRYKFEGILNSLGENEVPKLLYEGDISKSELYMLSILSRAGCDVLYLHFLNEDSYFKIDTASKLSQPVYGKKRGIPPTHFTAIDLKSLEQAKEMKKQQEAVKDALILNTWVHNSIFEEVFKNNSQRGALAGSKLYTLFGRYIGIDTIDEYKNRLFQLKKDLEQSHRPFVMIEGKMGNPSIEEVQKLPKIIYSDKKSLIDTSTASIHIAQDTILNAMVQKAFYDAMEAETQSSLSQLYNYGVKLLCWLNRYGTVLFHQFEQGVLPVFLYYGVCSVSEAEFLVLLSNMPVDVIYICPDKTCEEIFCKLGKRDKAIVEVLPATQAVFPFPQKEIKVRVATAAYTAQRELDTMLYSGTGLFRHRQFVRSTPVTLKTTYEEIELLWKEHAKYRPNFEAENGRVIVPTIFAKICGIKDGNIAAYYKTIENLLTEKTILIKKIPYITNETINSIKPHVHKFIANQEILPDIIKKHKEYQYDYLSEDIQDYILEKMQQMIDLNWIKADTLGVEFVILSTILNLDKPTLQLIQQFDFTAEIPKVVIIDTDEAMFSLEDCIYLLFLNLVGFDIAIFTPTGYRNIEKYVSRQAYEEYQIGSYFYNLHLPQFRLQAPNNPVSGGNLLNRIFGKGRN